MKHKVVSIVLSGLLILTSGVVVNANEANLDNKVESTEANDLKETKRIKEIREDNKIKAKDEEITSKGKLTKAYIEGLKKEYNVELKNISSNDTLSNMLKEKSVDNTGENFKMSKIIIQSRNPYKTVYFDDGTREEHYTKTMLVVSSIVHGSKEEYQNDYNVYLYAKMHYAKYNLANGNTQVRLESGAGKVVELYENGMRNLKIINTTYGPYENPDGSRGFTLRHDAFKTVTISSPRIGTLYSNISDNSNYYSMDAMAIIRVTLTIEWRHGTRYYTSEQDLDF